MKRSIFSVVIVLCSIALTPDIFAQGRIQVFGAAGSPVAPDDSDGLEFVRESLQRSININIADINRACDLSEEQLKKLEVAGKGAIVKALEIEQEQREQMQAQMGGINIQWAAPANGAAIVVNGNGFVIEEDIPVLEEGEFEVAEDDEAADGADELGIEEGQVELELVENGIAGAFVENFAPVFGFGNELISGVRPEHQEIWTNALDRTLTEEQKTAYQNHLDQRTQFQREAAVAQFMYRVDAKLMLSTEQREQLSGVVLEHYGDQLRSQMEMNNPMNMNMINVNFMQFNNDVEQVDEAFVETVESILNEDQSAIWMQQFELELTNGGNLWMGAPMMAPAVPFPNAPIQIEIDNNGG
ncbi:MAG: hypothetical protein AAF456_07090 [Planctomycetota bacterium]